MVGVQRLHKRSLVPGGPAPVIESVTLVIDAYSSRMARSQARIGVDSGMRSPRRPDRRMEVATIARDGNDPGYPRRPKS